MNKFEIGDKVSVLDEAMDGTVMAIKGNEITIETEDQFTMTYSAHELVKINHSGNLNYFVRSEAMDKKAIDTQLSRSQMELKKKMEKVERGVPEFDLHIEKLVKNKNGLTNYDILTLQLETAKRHVEFAIKNRIPKIVFIHGVGEGVLKTELDYMLKNYEMISFQDANYQKYGLGATEIYFRQNVR
ncbi:Smr/MutS family protein [Flavobacterium sp. SUN046]|uniref:Smr/MutS family protein n=1 Tax=Flavobacterium sp. SUN046 TaxID=3002440 RepID=UPI002DBF1DAD|nr:Smr/MutS family protein [Flavobacterium sp. SUN046]MEC4050642.1 Smr/MutS family protein [Flavobacterium sp. SUN046]